MESEKKAIKVIADVGVRYTVPSTIRISKISEVLTVRFRVGDVYRNAFIDVYFDEEKVIHRKRMMMAPGEMEEIKLKKEQMERCSDLKKITFKIENSIA